MLGWRKSTRAEERDDGGSGSSGEAGDGPAGGVVAITRECPTILGADGITLEYPVLQHANNLESVLTCEGTSEMHQLTIGKALTGQATFR